MNFGIGLPQVGRLADPDAVRTFAMAADATGIRHGVVRTGGRKWLDVHLTGAVLVRRINDPLPVRRKTWCILGRRRADHSPARGITGDPSVPDVVGMPRRRRAEYERLAIGTDQSLEHLLVLSALEQLRCAAMVGVLDPESGESAPTDARVQNALSVRRPLHAIVAGAFRRYARPRVGHDVIDPDVSRRRRADRNRDALAVGRESRKRVRPCGTQHRIDVAPGIDEHEIAERGARCVQK
jgi:hypothetical protein